MGKKGKGGGAFRELTKRRSISGIIEKWRGISGVNEKRGVFQELRKYEEVGILGSSRKYKEGYFGKYDERGGMHSGK